MDYEFKFQPWAQWYSDWESRQANFPWQHHRPLTMAEKQAISSSIAELQLGESSDGRHFFGAAIAHSAKILAPSYAASIREFIREENRHSEMLGRFMDMEGIKRIVHSKSDNLFRAMRHNLPLGWSHRILVTAELIAVPYYRALGKATCSPLLKAICGQILEDEARHIAYQAQCVSMFTPHGHFRRAFLKMITKIMLEIALDVVWWNHSDVLRRGGYTFALYRSEAIEQLEWFNDMVSGKISVPDPKQLGSSARSIEKGSTFHTSGI